MDSKRLLSLASLLEKGEFVADIGSDHGFLPLYLVKHGFPFVYASENKKGPYTRLKESVGDYPEIHVDFADGISNLPRAVNTVVIAGMGGSLITSILTKNQEKLQNVTKLVLSPQGGEEDVRSTLGKLGYAITKEEVVMEEGKYYQIMVGERKEKVPPLTSIELEYGPLNLLSRSATFIAMLQAEEKRLAALLLKKLSPSRQKEISKKRQRIQQIITKEDTDGNS